jgi:2-dehydropantoate 2-reductase
MADSEKEKTVLVIGAGGVGGFFGGKLCLADRAEVTFAARGDTLDALRKRGLEVRSVDGDFAIPDVSAVRLQEVDRAFDFVLVCVKNYDLEATLEHLQNAIGEQTAVVSLLNGFGADELISTTVGSSRAFGGLAYVGAHVEEPGVIIHTADGRIAVGSLPIPQETGNNFAPAAPAGDKRLEVLAELCEHAGFGCDIENDILRAQWRKLIWNAAINAVTALARCPVGEALAGSDGEAVVRAVMIEALMVGQSYGIRLDPSDIDSFLEHARDAEVRTSMEIDASRGRRLEVDAINGAVIRKARGVGVPTPVNQTLYSILKIIDARAEREGKS